MNNLRKLLLMALIGGFAFMTSPALAQCPMCKATITSATGEKKESKLAKGLNAGILTLFVLPYSLAAGVGIAFYLGYRKRKAARSEPSA